MQAPGNEKALDSAGYELQRFREVSVCELSGPERFVVWAIRWRSSAQDDEGFAADCLAEGECDFAMVLNAGERDVALLRQGRQDPLQGLPTAEKLNEVIQLVDPNDELVAMAQRGQDEWKLLRVFSTLHCRDRMLRGNNSKK